MARRKILILGATGFIGRNLVERFAGNPELEVHAVRFTRPAYPIADVQWHQADLRRAEDVDRVLSGADIVIQAAATTSGIKDIVTKPYIHTTDNAVMNSLLLRAAYEARVKHFVFFSCTVMHRSSERPLTEEDWDANRPMEPGYFASGWTKVYIEKLCEFYAGLGVTRHTVIRHSNVYGPHDKFDLERSHMFGATVTKVMTAGDGTVTVWGSGEEARDLLYVGDLAEFVERVVERQQKPFELFNAGGGRAITVNELVEKVIAASGRPLTISHDLAKPTIKTSLSLDCTKANRELGWTPQTTLETGIGRTLAWWREHHRSLPSQ